jgi:hypothetical protein
MFIESEACAPSGETGAPSVDEFFAVVVELQTVSTPGKNNNSNLNRLIFPIIYFLLLFVKRFGIV